MFWTSKLEWWIIAVGPGDTPTKKLCGLCQPRSFNLSFSARSPLCGQMVRAYMMIAVLLSLINMHKLQLVLPGLWIEIGVRVNKVDQVLIESHYLGKLGLWYHD